MSFIAGLVWGLVIAGLTVAAEHYGPSYRTLSLSGNGALAVISVLVPLAVYRGWTWVTNRWSGRAVVPAIAYVAGLWLGVGFVAPIDVLLYPQGPGSTLANAIPGLLLSGAVFVLPVALVAGAIYLALRSERMRPPGIVILLLYVVGVALGVVPLIGTIVGGGLIAGAAAGQVWRRGGGHTTASVLVILLMVVAAVGLPYLLAGGTLPALTLPG